MSKTKKILSGIVNTLTVLLMIFVICILIAAVVSVVAVGKTNASLFGYRIYIVQSDSMHEQFEAGDLIFSKVEDDYYDLEAGTIITFISEDSLSFGETITHMIKGSTTYNGSAAYITYGTTTGNEDSTPCPVENILGIYSFKISNMGYFFNFLQSPAGYVTVILVPFSILIAVNAYKLINTLRAINKEKESEQLQEKQDETAKLRAELEQLKAQLGGGSGNNSGDNSAAPDTPPATDGNDNSGGANEDA